MSYSEFSLAKAKKEFGLTTLEKRDIFATVPELTASNLLTETLNYNLAIALGSNNEKGVGNRVWGVGNPINELRGFKQGVIWCSIVLLNREKYLYI
ncbi:hypothetical protein [Scytonema sp. PCC 10023]|uniref:hypothetical protein n=1 Tax=Scytonema sp. PCC 10023 TaxID=1680591 RepID=UPI0039C7406D